MSVLKYPHGLACYPNGFRGTVVSPTKICIQYEKPQVKLRVVENKDDLIKLPSTQRAMPVTTDGIDIGVVAVGCQMPVLEQVQFGLLDAYIQYGRLHAETYRQTYNKEFIDFIRVLKSRVDNILDKLDE